MRQVEASSCHGNGDSVLVGATDEKLIRFDVDSVLTLGECREVSAQSI